MQGPGLPWMRHPRMAGRGRGIGDPQREMAEPVAVSRPGEGQERVDERVPFGSSSVIFTAAQAMRPASDFHCAGLPWKLETSTPRSILLAGLLTMLRRRVSRAEPFSIARLYREFCAEPTSDEVKRLVRDASAGPVAHSGRAGGTSCELARSVSL